MLVLIKRYRNFLMGVAILWVVMFHSKLDFSLSVFDYIKSVGYGGVDIFMFCSGFGIAHSLNRNPDFMSFYGRRLSRIVPTYYAFLVLFVLCKFVIKDYMNLMEILGNVTLTGWWNGVSNQFNWYIQALPFYYILSPIIYHIIASDDGKVGRCFFLSLLISFTFFCQTTLMAVSRFPVLIIGIYFGVLATKQDMKKQLSERKVYAMSGIAGIIGIAVLILSDVKYHDFLWDYGLWWYPFILIAPCMCVMIPLMCKYIDGIKPGKIMIRMIGFLGECSFEIYLVHICVFMIFERMKMNNVKWLVAILVAVLGGIGYHKCVDIFTKRINVKCR